MYLDLFQIYLDSDNKYLGCIATCTIHRNRMDANMPFSEHTNNTSYTFPYKIQNVNIIKIPFLIIYTPGFCLQGLIIFINFVDFQGTETNQIMCICLWEKGNDGETPAGKGTDTRS